MRILGHGIDLVECERIAAMRARHGDRFLQRILTEWERSYIVRFKDPTQRVAGRFAAKEAVLKMMGTGWVGRIAWTDIEIFNDSAGVPAVRLSGECARIAESRGITQILLSITHTPAFAAASAVGTGD